MFWGGFGQWSFDRRQRFFKVFLNISRYFCRVSSVLLCEFRFSLQQEPLLFVFLPQGSLALRLNELIRSVAKSSWSFLTGFLMVSSTSDPS